MQLGKRIKHNITIKPSDNGGYIVDIGYAIFVFESSAQMCSELSNFLNDPEKYYEQYNTVKKASSCIITKQTAAGALLEPDKSPVDYKIEHKPYIDL